ncbi:hypothetical protein [Nocardioides sp.]|uniref:hypothetical protein n=1 Tax=Nocardioides sp. TaxID=35761 RepID=UPI002B27522C|nr:hypothetical protein [Nocardioides sp.]
MPQQPKRLPGEANPTPDAAAPGHVARQSWMSRGQGDGDYGLVRGIVALVAWRQRRSTRKNR